MRASLDTKGINETLEDLLHKIEDIDDAAGDALAAGGDVLLQGMERRVPRDTNNLANHLERTPVEQEGNYLSIHVGLSKRANKRTAIYGTVQEYGSSSNAAQPYVRPTIDSDMSHAQRAIIDVLKEKAAT